MLVGLVSLEWLGDVGLWVVIDSVSLMIKIRFSGVMVYCSLRVQFIL